MGLAGLLAVPSNASASVDSRLMGKCVHCLSVTASYSSKANTPAMCSSGSRTIDCRSSEERGFAQAPKLNTIRKLVLFIIIIWRLSEGERRGVEGNGGCLKRPDSQKDNVIKAVYILMAQYGWFVLCLGLSHGGPAECSLNEMGNCAKYKWHCLRVG